jgi:amino-acid N-acetyltransferase
MNIIRPAKITDAKQIYGLVKYYANNREMLHRPINDIYESIQEFVVFEKENQIVGCGALHVSWKNLAEVKSLAILEGHKGQGLGRRIVKKLQENACVLEIYKIFVLSFKPDFFIKLDYTIISKDLLPHKIWRECVNCHLFPNCGEVPLLISLK